MIGGAWTIGLLAGCGPREAADMGGAAGGGASYAAGSFGDDLAFLSEHTDALALTDGAGRAQVVVVPAYLGRVMTSTTGGPEGPSFGWINRELIASGEKLAHMNPYGGEDRIWFGPEGGQFALFFEKGDPFDFDHWQTPALMDTERFDLMERRDDSAVFTKQATLINYSGTEFAFRILRTVNLIGAARAGELLGVNDLSGVDLVGYESVNKLINAGDTAWEQETGLPSIWILGMFNPSPETTIVIPIVEGSEDELGPKVNDTYFGKVPADRLRVEDDRMFFRGDGQYRSKIGVSPRRVKPVCGSYDAGGQVLTIVQFNRPAGATDYVNSMWELQDAPYGGDVVNSYNDGPPEPGAEPMGPFYELETSSPAAALGPGNSITHIHRTFHFQGEEAALDRISAAVLGVTLAEIRGAFAAQ
jgi:hypothetical protein